MDHRHVTGFHTICISILQTDSGKDLKGDQVRHGLLKMMWGLPPWTCIPCGSKRKIWMFAKTVWEFLSNRRL